MVQVGPGARLLPPLPWDSWATSQMHLLATILMKSTTLLRKCWGGQCPPEIQKGGKGTQYSLGNHVSRTCSTLHLYLDQVEITPAAWKKHLLTLDPIVHQTKESNSRSSVNLQPLFKEGESLTKGLEKATHTTVARVLNRLL